MCFAIEVFLLIWFLGLCGGADQLIQLDCSPAGKANWNNPILSSGVCQEILYGKTASILFHPQVECLYFNDSNLDSIQDNWLLNFKNLKELHLHNNNLKMLSSNSFKGLENLELLDLSFNSFTRMVESWFQNLSFLKIVKVDNCYIKYFEPKNFSWPKKLEYLSIRNNLLDIMPPMPLETVSLDNWNVSLEGNSIDCVCRRHEHNKTTFTKKVFHRIQSSCQSRKYADKEKREIRDVSGNRTESVWGKYLESDICEGPAVELIANCDIDGRCKVKCQASGRPQPYVSILNKGTNEEFERFNATTTVAYSYVALEGENATIKCETESFFMKQRPVSGSLLTTISMSEEATTTATTTTEENVTETETKDVMREQVNEVIRLDKVLSYLKKISVFMYIGLSVSVLSNAVFVYIVFTLCKQSEDQVEEEEITSGYIVIQG